MRQNKKGITPIRISLPGFGEAKREMRTIKFLSSGPAIFFYYYSIYPID
jgi:hypothetical protein